MVRKYSRGGMTLLELILALSISVIIMLAIGMAINLHLKTLQNRRTHVEEAQLARQVLRRMADDLRSAVQYQLIDFSSVEKLAQQSATSAASSALDSAGLSADETGLDASLLSGLAEEEEPLSISGTAAPPKIPGLYGNQYELQIDVSRIPRVDEYQTYFNPLSGETVADVPSDVKTVAYYLQPDAMATATTSTLNDPTAADRVRATGAVGRGIVRRELDRAVSMWAAENNNLEALATQGDMLAMEVTGLEFRYFDGSEWFTEWNSEERQGLPVAVAIAVEIAGDAGSSAEEEPRSLLEPIAAGTDPGGTANSSRLLYRLVVHLPASEPTSADTARFPETTESEETTGTATPTQPTEDGSSANNGGNQSGGGQSPTVSPGGQSGGQGGGGRGGLGSGGQSGGRGPSGGAQGGPGAGGFGGGQGGQGGGSGRRSGGGR